ncbi:MAG: transposase [Thermomicrobiales bacterium]|nr:transposase [Thermomicrobiales bacterium]
MVDDPATRTARREVGAVSASVAGAAGRGVGSPSCARPRRRRQGLQQPRGLAASAPPWHRHRLPRKRNERRDGRFDRTADRERNVVERTINCLKQHRTLATRYNKANGRSGKSAHG